MDPKFTDVHATVSLGKEKQSIRMAAFSGFGAALGIFCLVTGIPDLFFPGIVTLAVCGPITLFYLYRTLSPGTPFVVLSPEGILLLIEWVKQVSIPWTEVRGVDSITVTSDFRGDTVVHTDVTVFLVSSRFYQKHLHVDNFILQGPNWNAYFIPKGDMMQVALHHSMLDATAGELRAAVEIRWKAFGNPPGERPL